MNRTESYKGCQFDGKSQKKIRISVYSGGFSVDSIRNFPIGIKLISYLRQTENGQKTGPSFESAMAVSPIITLDYDSYRVNDTGFAPLRGLNEGIFCPFVRI